MKDDPEQILEQATREELSACIQLLAQSVVLHRAKFGVVTLHTSPQQTQDPEEGDEDAGLFVQGKEVLEEALEIVRTRAAASDSADSSESEGRTQLRINASVPIKVIGPDDRKPIDATLQNISWGGAAFLIDAAFDAEQLVRVILPRPQGGSISVESRVLRTWQPEGSELQGVSVRFASLNTRDEAKLEGILEHMAQSLEEEGQRMHARLAQRLDIEFNGVQELRSTLDDISAGGLGITVPDPMPVGQSLQTVISTLEDDCVLKLRARVVHQRAVKTQSGELYRIGLKFEHPTEELKKRVQELLGKMAAASQ